MTPSITAAVALAAATCWAYRPLVAPRLRYGMDIGDVRQHMRLLGRQRRLTALALALTALALVGLLAAPGDVNPDLRDLRLAAASCGQQESPYDPPTCYAMEAGGQWVVQEVQANGTRKMIATVTHPDFLRNATNRTGR